MELLTCTIVTCHLTRPVIMQIRKMADYNLLLVTIPEDIRKSEPITKKISLKLYFDMIFKPELGHNF